MEEENQKSPRKPNRRSRSCFRGRLAILNACAMLPPDLALLSRPERSAELRLVDEAIARCAGHGLAELVEAVDGVLALVAQLVGLI